MKNKSVCFTGHRNIPTEEQEEILRTLKTTLIALINSGYCCFWAGGTAYTVNYAKKQGIKIISIA